MGVIVVLKAKSLVHLPLIKWTLWASSIVVLRSQHNQHIVIVSLAYKVPSWICFLYRLYLQWLLRSNNIYLSTSLLSHPFFPTQERHHYPPHPSLELNKKKCRRNIGGVTKILRGIRKCVQNQYLRWKTLTRPQNRLMKKLEHSKAMGILLHKEK